MKAVAYNVEPLEKEFLAKANQKKHDITLIANPLAVDTANYAAGKDAVIVFTNDDIGVLMIEKLADLGVKYIITCLAEVDAVSIDAALTKGIKVTNIPAHLSGKQTDRALQEIADQTIKKLDYWQQNKNRPGYQVD